MAIRRNNRSPLTRIRGSAPSSPHQRRLALERLEDRRLLTITVNTLVDEADGSIVDGDISLRDAIAASPAGGTINFSVTGTINLALGAVVVQDRIIQGPGAAQLTINAHGASNVFTTRGTTTLSGLTITGGGTTLRGGGIRNESVFGNEGHLTVASSVVTGNTALFQGGGIDGGGSLGLYGSVTVVNSTISSNQALAISQGTQYGQGGGIYSGYAFLTVDKSTISGNHADRFGGGIYGGVTMTNSTVSGNTAGNGTFEDGAGIFVRGPLSVVNSTISGNAGTGIRFLNGFGGVVANSTVANNVFGIAAYGGATLLNTIVAGNVADITGTVDGSGSRNNLIGNPTNPDVANGGIGGPPAGGLTNGANGNIVGVANAGLGPLANNGGPTQTHALFSFSPAINRGDNSLIPINPSTGLPFTVDQTGAARIFGGGTVDMGAVEVQATIVPSTVVNTATDDVAANGLTSLREAIGFAFTLGGPVTFDPAVFATPQTIALVHGGMTVEGLAIAGPGANLATVDAGGASQLFANHGVSHVSGLTFTGGTDGDLIGAIGNAFDGTLTIQGCVISGNEASGITNRGALLVSGSTISNNHATGTGGGGIWVDEVGATSTTIVNSTISGNSSDSVTGGGGIFGRGTVTIRNSTISGNSTTGGPGGGIRQYSGSVTIHNSIIAGNLVLGSPKDIDALPDPASSYNLIGVVEIDPPPAVLTNGVNGNIVGVNPALVLGPLANNGGPTPTHALLPGSPAIDAGDPNAVPGIGNIPFSDQRGEARRLDGNGIDGLRIDIGAFEAPTVPPQLPGDYNLDRNVGAADYVAWRKILNFFVAPPYWGPDVDGNQMINQLDYNVWRTHFGQSLPGAGAGASNASFQVVALAAGVEVTSIVPSEGMTSVPTAVSDDTSVSASIATAAVGSPFVSLTDAERSPLARARRDATTISRTTDATLNDNALLAWLSSSCSMHHPSTEDAGASLHSDEDLSQADDAEADSAGEVLAVLANARIFDF